MSLIGLPPQDTAAQGSPPSGVNAPALVYHTDLLLLALTGCVVLQRLPRVLARFSRAAAWTHGHVLYAARAPRPRRPARPTPAPPPADRATDDSHTLFSHSSSAPPARAPGFRAAYPPHVAACPAPARALQALLRRRVAPGFSAGQALVLGAYLAVLVYAALVRSSPFTDPLRAGYVAMAQIPVVVALAAKNGVLGMLLGLGYEKVRVCQVGSGVC